jgi:hypothetical protein
LRRGAARLVAGLVPLALLVAPPAFAGYGSITELKAPAARDTSSFDPALARSVDSFGIGAGASALGFDHERLLDDHMGFQFGVGFLGFDAGLTWHFKRGIRTSHAVLGYYHYGFAGDVFAGGAIGVSLVGRNAGLVSGQFGFGSTIIAGSSDRGLRSGQPVIILSLTVCPRGR